MVHNVIVSPDVEIYYFYCQGRWITGINSIPDKFFRSESNVNLCVTFICSINISPNSLSYYLRAKRDHCIGTAGDVSPIPFRILTERQSRQITTYLNKY